jgi:fermentation-respiration switch protein FrsA (DUF1100 family)
MFTRGRPDARRKRTRVGLVVLVVGLAVGLVLGIAAGLQRRLIYFPDSSPVPAAGDVIEGARDITLRTSDGLELAAWFVPGDSAADLGLAVLIAPGNGGNRLGRAGLAVELSRRGLAVLLMDYRGYGGNRGTPSEDALLEDGIAAVHALEGMGYPPDRTIYFGESLGTGVVAALQARIPPAAQVLRSPFTDLADVGGHHYPWLPVRLLLRDRFDVLGHLEASAVPTTVIYGDRDSIVPPELSARVADAAGALVEELVIPAADHNDDVMFGPQVAEAVLRLAQQAT